LSSIYKQISLLCPEIEGNHVHPIVCRVNMW